MELSIKIKIVDSKLVVVDFHFNSVYTRFALKGRPSVIVFALLILLIGLNVFVNLSNWPLGTAHHFFKRFTLNFLVKNERKLDLLR